MRASAAGVPGGAPATPGHPGRQDRAALPVGPLPQRPAASDAATLRRARGCAVLKGLAVIHIGEAGVRGRPGGKPTWGRGCRPVPERSGRRRRPAGADGSRSPTSRHGDGSPGFTVPGSYGTSPTVADAGLSAGTASRISLMTQGKLAPSKPSSGFLTSTMSRYSAAFARSRASARLFGEMRSNTMGSFRHMSNRPRDGSTNRLVHRGPYESRWRSGRARCRAATGARSRGSSSCPPREARASTRHRHQPRRNPQRPQNRVGRRRPPYRRSSSAGARSAHLTRCP